ncbi:MAG: helix-turn-helix domain-containing protein [Roseiflexaceae bacterium]
MSNDAHNPTYQSMGNIHPSDQELHGQEWMSLQEASDRLGVATATLRRWGDAGKVVMKRTLGGHRRFQVASVEALAQQLSSTNAIVPAAAAPPRLWGVDQRELSRQNWHARLASRAQPDRLRGLGQRLLGLLIQFINRQPEDQRFLEEASAVGMTYGREAREAGISMHDTVEAFLFFRSSFAQLAMPLPGIAQPTDLAEAANLHARIQRFMDVTLLGTIKGYEQG